MMSLHDEKLLDDIGWHLLEELQEDARLTYAELGRRVGLSTFLGRMLKSASATTSGVETKAC